MTPPLPLNCPKCPRALAFITSHQRMDIRIYRCSVHGEWHLGPGGVFYWPKHTTPKPGRMLERHVNSD